MGEKKRKLLLSKEQIKRLEKPPKKDELFADYKAFRKFTLYTIQELARFQGEANKFLKSWSDELHDWRERLNAWNKTMETINAVLKELDKKEGKRRVAKYIG